MPAGLEYVAGSLVIASGPGEGTLTDDAGDDAGEYVSGSRMLTLRLGTGADSAEGGSLEPGESVVVRYRATVTEAAAGTTVSNQASVSAAGEAGAATSATLSDGDLDAPGNQPTDVRVVAEVSGEGGNAGAEPQPTAGAAGEVGAEGGAAGERAEGGADSGGASGNDGTAQGGTAQGGTGRGGASGAGRGGGAGRAGSSGVERGRAGSSGVERGRAGSSGVERREWREWWERRNEGQRQRRLGRNRRLRLQSSRSSRWSSTRSALRPLGGALGMAPSAVSASLAATRTSKLSRTWWQPRADTSPIPPCAPGDPPPPRYGMHRFGFGG